MFTVKVDRSGKTAPHLVRVVTMSPYDVARHSNEQRLFWVKFYGGAILISPANAIAYSNAELEICGVHGLPVEADVNITVTLKE